MTFVKYYQSELNYLRELGREFTDAHPSLAGSFAERGGDPDVQRLLEGFAFLTARIRQRVDDAVPEMSEALANLLVPEMHRTIPACSILSFTPNHAAIRGRMEIPANTEVASRSIDGTSCLFRTTSPVTLLPLTMRDAVLDDTFASTPRISLRLQITAAESSAVFAQDGIRFHLHGPLGLSSTLFLWMKQHLKHVEVKNPDSGQIVHLPPASLRFPAADQTMLPRGRMSAPGAALLREYLTLQAKFLFFDLCDLDKATACASSERSTSKNLHIDFVFRDPPKLHDRVRRENFQLHATPVVNVFERTADPVRKKVGTREYLLRAAGLDPRHMEILEVLHVEGLSAKRTSTRGKSGGRQHYAPFSAYRESGENKGDAGYFSVERRPSPIDGWVDAYLSIQTPRDLPIELPHDENSSNSTRIQGEEILSIDLLCTNRKLPAALRVGDISVQTSQSPSFATFTNITEVTHPVAPPLGSTLQWKLLGQLSSKLGSISTAESLRAQIALHNCYRESDEQLFRSHERRIEAIRSATTVAGRRLFERSVIRGSRTTVELDASGFSNLGDAYLFASALESFYTDRVPLNTYHELDVVIHPSGLRWKFGARSGSRRLA